MIENHSPQSPSYITDLDRKRRKREMILLCAIILVVALLTYAENRIVHFGADFPVSNSILMFILININLLLLILLFFLVFRNLVKLLYDRKRKVMGAKLRTRLVLAFVTLSLMPTTVLFFFSINFINTSMEFWFSVPVEQALKDSLLVGRGIYSQTEETHLFFLKKMAARIHAEKLLEAERMDLLRHYIQQSSSDYHLQAVEVYSTNFARKAFVVEEAIKKTAFRMVPADYFQKPLSEKKIGTMFEKSSDGELVRTLCRVPFDSPMDKAEGFVVLSKRIPAHFSDKMASISRGFEGYQQMILLKRPIQITYYISLSIVGLLVMFCAVWFGFYLAKTISIPIKELAEGTMKVAGGDLNFSIAPVGDDEIGSLVSSFNQMTRDLQDSRRKLELSASILRKQNSEIEEKKQYMEFVLRYVSAGVISLDANGTITTMNKAAEKMLHLNAEQILNKKVTTALSGEFLPLAEEIMENLAVSRDGNLELPARISINGRVKSFLLHVNTLTDDTGLSLGTVVVFDDLTALEKAQRMVAWREVARRIAHEVKNPLTPITLSAQRLQRKYAEKINEPVFEECTRMIIDHVALIRNLVNEFSAFARFPSAQPVPCDLPSIIEETVALYREGHEAVAFQVHIQSNLPKMNLDRQQIKQAMINLMENAVAAMRMQGTVEINVDHDAILKRVRIEVADNGPGIPDNEKVRLFEPYFSTKKSGMGLGLTIVNSIIADHGGVIRVQDNPPRGAKFVVELPV